MIMRSLSIITLTTLVAGLISISAQADTLPGE